MKLRSFFLCVAILPLSVSCNSFEEYGFATNLERKAHRISLDEARKTIQDAVDYLYSPTKGFSCKSIAEEFCIDSHTMTKSNQIICPEDSIPPYYVFNFADNRGYALASADDRMSPILCIVDMGSFHIDSALTNPGQIAMLSRIETEYKMAIGMPIVGRDGRVITAAEYGPLPPLSLTRGEDYPSGHWTTTTNYGDTLQIVNPMLATRWGQRAPFNGLMFNSNGEKCPAGCVNIAVAQVLNYHSKNFIIDNYYVDWTPIHTVLSPSDSGTLAGRTMLQNYLYKAAVAMNANMTPNGTGINPAVVPGFISSLGYTSGGTFEDYSLSPIRLELQNGYPVLVGGYEYIIYTHVFGAPVSVSYNGGHRWVADGLIEEKVTHHGVGTPPQPDYYTYSSLLHCNFGLGGIHDGYYYSSQFNASINPPYTKSGVTSDVNREYSDTIGNEWNFQYGLSIITGIRP